MATSRASYPGAPLALLCVAVITLAERVAVHYERDGTAWSRVEPEPESGTTGEVAPQA